MIPKSIDILGQAAKFSSIKCFSSGVLNTLMFSSNRFEISGKNRWNALIIVCTFQMKIPEFQKNSPLSTNILANSRLGFSVNVFTVFMLSSASSPI